MSSAARKQGLIESDWNLKEVSSSMILAVSLPGLIESDWNLKDKVSSK